MWYLIIIYIPPGLASGLLVGDHNLHCAVHLLPIQGIIHIVLKYESVYNKNNIKKLGLSWAKLNSKFAS